MGMDYERILIIKYDVERPIFWYIWSVPASMRLLSSQSLLF